MIKDFKAKAVSGFYKSNYSNGIAVTVKFVTEEIRQAFLLAYEGYEELWSCANKEERDSWIEFCFQHIENIIKTDPVSRDLGQGSIALINILFLVSHGYITEDSFNGFFVVYEK